MLTLRVSKNISHMPNITLVTQEPNIVSISTQLEHAIFFLSYAVIELMLFFFFLIGTMANNKLKNYPQMDKACFQSCSKTKHS